jgi:proline racemase
MHSLHFIDSHTGGEPTRLVLDGLPAAVLAAGSPARIRDLLAREHDRFRRAAALEPRASDVVVGAFLTPPATPGAAAGVVFFNNVGYLGMCGHGSIGVIASLAWLGRLQPGVHALDTPVGTVRCELHADGAVSVHNVPAYRLHRQRRVQVPGRGEVTGDIAWGGNWFFLTESHPVPLAKAHVAELTAYALQIKAALAAAGITGAGGAEIDHVELFSDSPTPGVDSRNFVLCPGAAYDRSPCGTGTSAKLACLAADGLLAPGATWRQESVIGSVFEARCTPADGGVLPVITGRAHVCAEGRLIVDPADAFGWGIPA